MDDSMSTLLFCTTDVHQDSLSPIMIAARLRNPRRVATLASDSRRFWLIRSVIDVSSGDGERNCFLGDFGGGGFAELEARCGEGSAGESTKSSSDGVVGGCCTS